MYLKQPNTAGHSESGKEDKCVGKGREKNFFSIPEMFNFLFHCSYMWLMYF